MGPLSIQNPLAVKVYYKDGFPVLTGAWPVLGHIPEIVRHIDSLARRGQAEHGPIFGVRGGPLGDSLFVCGPLGLELLRSKSARTEYGGLPLTRVLLGARGLLSLNGLPHQKLRGALNPTFAPRGLSLSTVGRTSEEVIKRHVAELHLHKPFAALPVMQRMTLEIIFRLFEVPLDEMEVWRKKYRELLGFRVPLTIDLPGSPWRRALRAQEWLDARLLEFVKRARARLRADEAGDKSDSLLAALARARDENGDLVDEEDLAVNLRLLLLAGHETTASVTAWMLLRLADDQELSIALREEARQGGELPRVPADLKRFPLAEGLFRESLRLHMPVQIVSRTVTEPMMLGDALLKAGTRCNVILSSIAREESLFPEPERFDPRRWAGRSLTPLEISQFGGGAHFCLGYHLAVLEGAQLAVALAHRLDYLAGSLHPVGSGPVKVITYPLVHPHPSTQLVIS
ncbi:MAG: cytochrome P450 [Polyangia bacterium]